MQTCGADLVRRYNVGRALVLNSSPALASAMSRSDHPMCASSSVNLTMNTPVSPPQQPKMLGSAPPPPPPLLVCTWKPGT
jgi:hypothetical protein